MLVHVASAPLFLGYQNQHCHLPPTVLRAVFLKYNFSAENEAQFGVLPRRLGIPCLHSKYLENRYDGPNIN